MRILFILRGNYFNGQKEWLNKNKLSKYCLDLDEFKFLASGLKSLTNGYKSLEHENSAEILKMLMKFLELRMQKGYFCVVNAPNVSNSLLKEYKNLAQKYRYTSYIIDFNSLSLDECKEKNITQAQQSGIFIPEHVLEAIDYALNKEKISKKYKILDPNEYKKVLFKSGRLGSPKETLLTPNTV